jgi:very-short-patch-repair endonuclease
MTVLEAQLRSFCKHNGWPEPRTEHRFHPVRMWRFDYAWPSRMLALEIEGVVPGKGGRHQRVAGYEKDCEKYNEAQLWGWKVLRFTQRQVKSGELYTLLERAFTLPKG